MTEQLDITALTNLLLVDFRIGQAGAVHRDWIFLLPPSTSNFELGKPISIGSLLSVREMRGLVVAEELGLFPCFHLGWNTSLSYLIRYGDCTIHKCEQP